MTQGQILEKWYVEKHGELKAPERLTELFAKGKTLLYGASGAGKTYSAIKHLNRNKITPILIDFDNNYKPDGIEFNYIGGKEFIDGFFHVPESAKREHRKEQNAEIDLLNEKITDVTAKYFDKYKESESKRLGYSVDYVINDFQIRATSEMFPELENIILELEYQISIIEDVKVKPIENIFKIENEVLIIDTCAKALTHFKDFNGFEHFVNMLLKLGNDIVLIAHTNLKGNDKVPDIDEVFANHCDCKLELNRDITKTKGEDVYLIVRKLRGNKGQHTIKNWER